MLLYALLLCGMVALDLKWIEEVNGQLNQWLVILTSILLGVGGAGSLWWVLFRWKKIREWLSLQKAPILQLNPVWIFLYGLLLCSMVAIDLNWIRGAGEWSGFLMIVSILFPFWILQFSGKLPLHFWKLSMSELPSYLKISGQVLCWVIVPLYTLAALCDWIFRLWFDTITIQPAVEMLQNVKTYSQAFQVIFLTILLAPLWEEIIFRGMWYPIFKNIFGKWPAICITSILFALMHAHGPTFFPLMAFGIVLVILYEATGSLGYPIAFHALFNAVSTIFILLM